MHCEQTLQSAAFDMESCLWVPIAFEGHHGVSMSQAQFQSGGQEIRPTHNFSFNIDAGHGRREYR
jgi:hypothetical protein